MIINHPQSTFLLATVIFIASTALNLYAADTPVDRQFMSWKKGFREKAFQLGISYATFDMATENLTPDSAVIKLDRNQPETTLTLQRYLDGSVNERRVIMAQKLFAKHNYLLNEIRQKYGVSPSLLLSLWAIETDFGRNLGRSPTIRSLLTLAYDQRRSAFFSGELIDVFYLVQANLLQLSDLKGSWAGAMGQFQFLPSVIRQYAVDYDGDGRLNLFEPTPDAFATAANYLAGSGWDQTLPWGVETKPVQKIRLPMDSTNGYKPLEYWDSLGINRQHLPANLDSDTLLKVILPDGDEGRRFLVSKNFETILV